MVDDIVNEINDVEFLEKPHPRTIQSPVWRDQGRWKQSVSVRTLTSAREILPLSHTRPADKYETVSSLSLTVGHGRG